MAESRDHFLITEQIFLVSDPSALKDNFILEQLTEQVNYLINNNFEKLISLLYRIDVSETKLRSLLESNQKTDAGSIIAKMIIERQLEKIALRAKFKSDSDFNQEERW